MERRFLAAVKLNAAARELVFLMDRGYDTKSASTFYSEQMRQLVHLNHRLIEKTVPGAWIFRQDRTMN